MSTTNIDSALSSAQAEIRALREQLEALTTDHVEPALREAAGQARQAMNRASNMARDEADQAVDFVRQRPVASVLAAAAVGFVIARLTR